LAESPELVTVRESRPSAISMEPLDVSARPLAGSISRRLATVPAGRSKLKRAMRDVLRMSAEMNTTDYGASVHDQT
jgi:hypothetical protein